MDTEKLKSLVGMRGGKDETFFEIVAVADDSVESPYYPAIDPATGAELPRALFERPLEEYLRLKQERRRTAWRIAVAGNAVCAEKTLKDLGYRCLAQSPSLVEIFEQ